MKKRMLCILLSFCMVLALTPMAIFAEGESAIMSEADFKAAITNANDGDTVELTGNVTLSSTVIITKNLKITSGSGGPYTIMRGSEFTSYLLGENSAGKTLTLENVIIDGSSSSVTAAKPLVIANAGNITLNTGAVLQNNKNGTANGTGGGAQVQANCTLIMNGGTIKNCSSDMGGGVFVIGTFTMNNGSIISDCTGKYGGGVMIYTNGRFNLSGGTITSNSSPSSSGGGVYVNSNGYFNMSGGNITNNTSYGGGGGIFATTFATTDTTFTITGGTISGNKSTASYGGGISINKRNASISGATIENNEALAGGGGIYHKGDSATNYTLSISDTSISGNKSTYQDVDGSYGGGGIYEATYGKLSISGQTSITDNLAHSDGGGIYIASDVTAELSGTDANPVIISRNRAYGWSGTNENYSGGGGIYGSSNATLKLNGTISITENRTDSLGGGIQGCTNNPNAGLSIQMGGKIIIKDNVSISTPTDDVSNLFISLPMTLTGSGLLEGSSVGITTQDDPCVVKDTSGTVVTPGHDVPFTTTEADTTLYIANRDYFFSDYGYPIGAGGTTGKCDYIMPPEEKPVVTGSDVSTTYGNISEATTVGYTEDDRYTYSQQWYEGSSAEESNLINGETKKSYTLPTSLSAGSHTYTVRVTATLKNSSRTAYADKTFTVEVDKAKLTINGATAVNRVYNGLNTVAIKNGTLNGIVSGDERKVSLSGIPVGSIASANVGDNKDVTVTGYKLSGEKAENYTVIQPTDLTVNITAAPIIIQWQNIVAIYDGNIQQANVASFTGKVGSEDVSVAIIEGQVLAGSYMQTAELTGNDTENYFLSNPTSSFTIQRAPINFDIINNTVKADGTSHTATVTANISSDKYKITYRQNGITVTEPAKAGIYDIYAEITDDNYRHSSAIDGRASKIGILTIYEEKAPKTYAINFNTDGGTYIPSMSAAECGTIRTLPSAPTKEGYVFIGWKHNGKIYQAGDKFTQSNSPVTFTAIWENNTYEVSGVIDQNGNPITGAVVTLTLGSKQIAQTTTDSVGKYSFTNVASGLYNLRAEWNGIIRTIAVQIISQNMDNQNIIIPTSKTNSVVDIAAGTPDTVVAALDKTFDDTSIYTAGDETIVNEGGSVEIRAEVKDSNNILGQAAIEGKLDDKESIELYLDIDLKKIVKKADGSIESTENITETEHLLTFTIALPAELQGKENYVVYRHHDGALGSGSVQQITTTANPDGEYIEVNNDKTEIIVHVNKFSVYGIGYSTSEITFNANGGICEIVTQITDGEGKLISLPTPTRIGNYHFDGWFTAANGGAKVTTSTVFSDKATVYAHWTYTGTDSTNTGGATTPTDISTNINGTKSPTTGDMSNMEPWAVLIIISWVAIFVVYKKKTDK